MFNLFKAKRLAQAGALAIAVAFVAGTTGAFAASSSREAASEDRPTAEATISDADNDTLLVHTQSASQHSVCADAHGTTDVVVKYDDNETTVSPGHCALVEAGHISAHAGGAGQTHVTVHSGGGGREGKSD
jgi:hypothetical protein